MSQKIKPDYMRRLRELLHEIGGTHSLEDLQALLAMGEMQSFVEGDTWVVTSILNFPQAMVMDIFLVVGDRKDFEPLEKKIETFARDMGVTFMRVYARKGFEYLIDRKDWRFGTGWKAGPRVYTKRLDMH